MYTQRLVLIVTAFILTQAVCSVSGYESGLSRSDILLRDINKGLDTHLLIGNGDLMGAVERIDDDLIIYLSKNDIWDCRLETEHDAPLVPLKDIIQIANEGADGKPPQEALNDLFKKHAPNDDSYHRNPYPCPRMAARIRLTIPSFEKKITSARVRLSEGIAEINFASGGIMRLLILADSNIFMIQCTDMETPKAVLEPILDPDILPPPISGANGSAQWITQIIPGDEDAPGMLFAAALRPMKDGSLVSVVTSREQTDPLQSAQRALTAQAKIPIEQSLEEHGAWWERYWADSAISLSDSYLESLWYRQMYFTAISIRPEKQAPGLFAPLTTNRPAWHGDYHTNYNIQQTFWAVLENNHPEWMEPYNRIVVDYLPRAQWLAKEIYDVKGAFYPHVIFAYEPPPEKCVSVNKRQYLHIQWGYTLGVTAFTVQNLWWSYEYAPNPFFLRKTVYPVVKETARFYTRLLERFKENDGYSYPPTVSPEHWSGWAPQLSRNRNCAFDTALIAFNLNAAIQASKILHVDRDERQTWEKALKLLPPYPTYGEDEPIIVDVAGAPPIEYNIPIPSTVIFPGEHLSFFSSKKQKQIFQRTIAGMRSNGNNDTVINSIARARLSMPDAFEHLKREAQARQRPNGTLTLNRIEGAHRFNEFGHYTEMFGAAAGVSELLMQSVDGIIRFFPAWPHEKDAAFNTLRAKGGFLVSAQLVSGEVSDATIYSEVGGDCQWLPPWPQCSLVDEEGKKVRLIKNVNGVIQARLKANQTYYLLGD